MFTFTNIAKDQRPKKPRIAVWTDGVVLSTEESLEDRKAGFIPAFRLKAGKKYKITIEEVP